MTYKKSRLVEYYTGCKSSGGNDKSVDGAKNAFRIPIGNNGRRRVTLQDVFDHFPFEHHDFRFSFNVFDKPHLFADIDDPNEYLPTNRRCIEAKVFPVINNDDKLKSKLASSNEQPKITSNTKKSKIKSNTEKSKITSNNSLESRQQQHSSSSWSNEQQESNSSWKTRATDAVVSTTSSAAAALASSMEVSKNLNDAKKKTSRFAKKFTGSILSSINSMSSSLSSSSQITIGPYCVTILKTLATGGYSTVHLVNDEKTNQKFALKKIVCQSAEHQAEIQNEVQAHIATEASANVLTLLGHVSVQGVYYLLFPLYESVLSDVKLFDNETQILNIFREICTGVMALHSAGYSHRDLKPHNVLLNPSSIVVTDLGSVAPLVSRVESAQEASMLTETADRMSSAPYRAPELFNVMHPVVIEGGQTDVWSLGCILYAMAVGHSPFEDPKSGFMKLACLNGNIKFPEEVKEKFSPDFIEFVKDMLSVDADERPSVYDVLDIIQELL